jgi:hypothetical protein
MSERPTYTDLVAAIDSAMAAHSAELRGGRTQELKAATSKAYATACQLAYAATDRPERPPELPDDPKLPIRRDLRKP